MELRTIKKSSMYPTLIEGDKIVIANKRKYSIADIIVYKHKKELIAHRLISYDKNKNKLVLKGDNNYKSETIKKEQVVGIIVFINKKKFKNNFVQKIIAKLSNKQKNILKNKEKNTLKRRIKKILTNPILYIVNIKRLLTNNINK